MDNRPEALAARLSELRILLEQPPGVILGVLRLPLLDPVLDDLDGAIGPGQSGLAMTQDLKTEMVRTAELLARDMLGTAPEAVGRRARLVELLRLADGGRLPPLAFDAADAFGDELRTMLETDRELALALGRLHPLLARASTVAPSAAWRSAAAALAHGADADALAAATRRTLAALLRAAIVSRPALLVGGLRHVNQRLARGLLWFAAEAMDRPAELLGAVGLRMGTSGRRDAVARDIATANACAALLATTADPGGAAALASMRLRITNRTILKQVDRALAAIAARSGTTVPALIEDALPTFGMDRDGRLELEVRDATAILQLRDDGRVAIAWRLADGRMLGDAPPALADSRPDLLAEVTARAEAIEAAWSEERSRMELRLGSTRTWPEAAFRVRFVEHPIGGKFGRRLVWSVGVDGTAPRTARPDGDGWVGRDGRPLATTPAARVGLWHPAESPDDVDAWRAELAIANVKPPIRQVDREAFQVRVGDRGLAADRRFAGRIVDHARMRALLRQRGWAVPALGAWDQGDEASAWRAFDDGLRAELRYQAVEMVPTGGRHERARLVAVRFTSGDASTAGDRGASLVALVDVPARVFSEAIRDVSLVVAVGGTGSGSA